MMEALKQRLKWVLPEFLITATRPIRLFFHPQRRFDRKFSVNTYGLLEPDQLEAKGPTVAHAGGYEPTSQAVFVKIIQSLHIDYPRFLFLDLGSGKGAALLYASEFPFKRVLGVEFSPALHRMAERNIASYRSRTIQCRNVQSMYMDATLFLLPPEPTVLYLFNPFKGDALETVVANTRRSLKNCPREMIVIYAHPLSRHPAWDKAEFLQQTRRDRVHTIYRSLHQPLNLPALVKE